MKTKARGNILQNQNIDRSDSQKVSEMLSVPDQVIDVSQAATDPNQNWTLVGKGNICRIRVAAACLITFNDSGSGSAPTSTTQETLELPVAGTYSVVSTGKFIRSSAAIARLEVINN